LPKLSYFHIFRKKIVETKLTDYIQNISHFEDKYWSYFQESCKTYQTINRRKSNGNKEKINIATKENGN